MSQDIYFLKKNKNFRPEYLEQWQKISQETRVIGRYCVQMVQNQGYHSTHERRLTVTTNYKKKNSSEGAQLYKTLGWIKPCPTRNLNERKMEILMDIALAYKHDRIYCFKTV